MQQMRKSPHLKATVKPVQRTSQPRDSGHGGSAQPRRGLRRRSQRLGVANAVSPGKRHRVKLQGPNRPVLICGFATLNSKVETSLLLQKDFEWGFLVRAWTWKLLLIF